MEIIKKQKAKRLHGILILIFACNLNVFSTTYEITGAWWAYIKDNSE